MTYHIVKRFDTDKGNVTYNTWVTVAVFKTEAEAKDYVKRAEGPTQRLEYRREERKGEDV